MKNPTKESLLQQMSILRADSRAICDRLVEIEVHMNTIRLSQERVKTLTDEVRDIMETQNYA